MPTWAQNPTTQRQKRKRQVISLDDSDIESNNDTDSEEQHKEEESRRNKHLQKKIKVDHKTNRIRSKKRKKTTAAIITPEHRYKTHRTRKAANISDTE